MICVLPSIAAGRVITQESMQKLGEDVKEQGRALLAGARTDFEM
jgi:hypothetical protein